MKFLETKTVRIPRWAVHIKLIANGIDGYPPNLPHWLEVGDFLASAAELQHRTGGGEWDVHAYAVENVHAITEYHPFGPGNPYRLGRRAPRSPWRMQRIATWSYMRWNFHRFTHATIPTATATRHRTTPPQAPPPPAHPRL